MTNGMPPRTLRSPGPPLEGSAVRPARASRGWRPLVELLVTTLHLGLTSFGGPFAHLGYFHQEYVVRRRWLDEEAYADLVALCQFLPGPASSQVGIAVGMRRAGILGGIVSWLGFTLPSALALGLFAGALQGMDLSRAGWLHGLLVVAVAVVAQAVWTMGRSLAPDRERATLAIASAVALLVWPSAQAQAAVIVVAGILGWAFLPPASGPAAPTGGFAPLRLRAGVWALFFGLLVGLPLLRALVAHPALAVLDSFYRAGSLVFGGGHVVLPLLQAQVVSAGWVDETTFLAGYGAAQAVPGPLFTFAAYLGVSMGGWAHGALALGAIFLPSFLLVAGTFPVWERVRHRPGMRAALRGVNAAVVGILLAALYDPIWTEAIQGPVDFALALAAFAMLVFWRLPPWIVVAFSAAVGWALAVVR